MDLCQLLPSTFAKSINLSSKQIDHITKLQSNSKFLLIQHLHLSHNQLSNLCGIEQFQQLKSLSLSNNQIIDINQLKRVTKDLQYLTIHSNPLLVYDYNDVCYNLFPKLKRLDGMAVEMSLVKQQRIYAEHVSRWLIPWIQTIKIHINKIQSILSLRNAMKEIDASTQAKLIQSDIVLQTNWQEINKQLQFLNQPNLINLAKEVSSYQYSQELDKTQVREMKKIHYDTFLDFIKQQSANHFTSFIDYLIRLNGDKQSDYYQTFLTIQKPQLHISSDLYPKEDDEIILQPPLKIEQYVPPFLKDKIKCQDVISNTYRKEREIQVYEKQSFFQYFPVFPFRTEYVQGIVQLVVLLLQELKTAVSQVAYLQQSAPSTVRTLRRKPNPIKKEPAPEKLTLKPQQLDETPREEIKQEENKVVTKRYNEVKQEILTTQNTNNLIIQLDKIFNRRMRRYLGRIVNSNQENTMLLDYPQQIRLSTLFYAFLQSLEKSKQKRIKHQNKKLLTIAFLGLKLQKKTKLRNLKQLNKGYQILQKMYFKRLIDGIRSLKKPIAFQPTQTQKKFRLQLVEAPFKTQKQQLILRNYNDENSENMKLCSVCTYNL